jgi:hypothetical protein
LGNERGTKTCPNLTVLFISFFVLRDSPLLMVPIMLIRGIGFHGTCSVSHLKYVCSRQPWLLAVKPIRDGLCPPVLRRRISLAGAPVGGDCHAFQ